MLKHYFTAIFLIFLTGCSPETKTPAALLDFMPGESFAIFRINRLSSFKSELKNNQVISAWQETSLYKEMAAKISPLEYLESNSHALIAFVQSANDTIDYILATPSETGTFNPGIATDLTVESIRFEGHEFQEYGINGARLYSATQDSTLLMSSSRSLLQEVIDTEDTPLEDRVLSSLYQAANPERSASAFIRLKPFGMALKNIFNPEAAE